MEAEVRLEKANAVAGEAALSHVGGYVQRAEVAMRREDWSLAVGHWESVREGFPEEPFRVMSVARSPDECGEWRRPCSWRRTQWGGIPERSKS